VGAAAQDPLTAIRDLYANADYDGALGALDRLDIETTSYDAIEGNQYRALCLFALGRTTDAEAVIEQIVRLKPAFTPGDDAAPRVRTAFERVRLRVLPEVARSNYASARAAYDRKEFAAAAPAFEEVLALLDVLSTSTSDPAVSDLRTLASGFLDLSKAALTPPPPPPTPEPAGKPAAPAPARVAPEPTVDPVVIQQVLPQWNAGWLGAQAQMEFRGAVEIVIDEEGAVSSARIVDSVHPTYDPALLEAARGWRYRPATTGGKPVTSTKRVEVVLRPR
jgi:TonB family protein